MLLDFPLLRVDTLKCSINNIPVSLTGTIRFDEGVSLDGVLSVFFAKALPAQQTEKFRKMSLSFNGRLRDKVVAGDGVLGLSFNAKDAASPLERLQLSFSGARYDFGRLKRQSISLDAAAVECETGSNLYQIELHDLYAALRLEGKKSYDAGLRADCSSGELTGKARIDMEDFPPRVDATLRLNGVEANELRGLLVHFSKVRGSLFSQMKFSTYPRASLRGDISINEGSLRDFEFFKWLSDRFHLPSLRRIDFRRASFNFAVDERGARMQDIRLDSPDALIAGFFHLGESDMVTSKISLSLSKPVLRESRKFRRLLSLLRKDDPAYLQFDFQLSGLLHGMNFKWLESHFKRELQRRIPNFIERRLEQGIEDLLTGE